MSRRSKLDAHEAFLRGLIDAKDDITLEAMRARLRDEHDLAVGLATPWSFLDARDLADEERQLAPPSKNARTCKSART